MESRAQIPVNPPISNPLPSYWQDPKCPLPSTPPEQLLTDPYDYAIVGSGITGTSIAYNILKANPNSRIIILEARDLCSGATGRNGGHTKAASYRTYLQHKEELGKEEALRIARLEYANIIETHALAKELNLDCDNQICNTVDIIYDAATFVQGKAAIEALAADATEEERQLGKMAHYRIYERDSGIAQKFWVQMKNTNPSVSQAGTEKEQVHGAFEYLAGRIHAYRFATSLLTHLATTYPNLHILTHTPVHALTPSPSSTHQKTWTLQTSTTPIQTSTPILATNGYTPYLVPTLQSSIVPLRGQITTFTSTPLAPHPSVLPRTYSFIYASGYEYMVSRNLPSGTQHIVIGGGLGRLPQGGTSEYGTVDDGVVNEGVAGYLRGTLGGYFGSGRKNGRTDTTTDTTNTTRTAASADNEKESENEETHTHLAQWTGIMGATLDGRPFVGEVPGQSGVWVCAGFNGHGMVLCWKVAEGLVGMMTGGEVAGWFPGSFLVNEERLEGKFGGRTDMKVPETGERAVA